MADTPFISDDVGEMEAQRRAAFDRSGFGWIDSKLKGASDWIKQKAQRTKPTSSVKDLPFASFPSPVELIPMMATEGARTVNRWLYGTKDPGMLRPEDTLAPTGAGAMAAPFVAAKHGVSLGTSGGKLAAQAPFQRQVDDLGYYSKLDEVLGGLKPTDTVTMDTLAKRGVKAAEVEARGLSPFFETGGAKVADLQKSAQPVQLRESRYQSDPFFKDQELQVGSNPAKGTPKWRDYATDGDNPTYHEGVLHLPPGNKTVSDDGLASYRGGQPADPGDFQSGHWDEPNAIAHYRASMQPTADGQQAYLLDELQSDWGQKLRDGGMRDEAKIADLRQRKADNETRTQALVDEGRDPKTNRLMREQEWLDARKEHDLLDAELRTAEAATPGNPFVNTSEQWMTTALRRMMRNAADQDAQGIAITPGAIHNERFGLEKQIKELEYDPDSKILTARPHDGRRGITEENVTPEKLAQLVGKETAEKLLATPAAPGFSGRPAHILAGQDLRMGGEGMKYAYDKMLPKLLQKELQKLDPSIKYGQQHLGPYSTDPNFVQSDQWRLGDGQTPFHYFPLTDQARAKIKEGLPLFNAPGGPEALMQALAAQQQLQGPFQEE